MANIFDMQAQNPTPQTTPQADWREMFSNPQTNSQLKSMANNIKAMMGAGNGQQDPMAMLMDTMAQKNPQLGQITQMLKGGTSPQQLVEQQLQTKGIPVNEFMNYIKQMI